MNVLVAAARLAADHRGLMMCRAELLGALGVFCLACEPPPLSGFEPSFPQLDVWPPNREVCELGERTFIDPTKVEKIVPIQLVDGPPMKLETRSLGKPKVLLPKQEGTYYPAKHALTNRRAMVHRVDEDKHGIVRKVHEAYLVDFEDGVVEHFSGMSRFEQYSEAGVGIAWQMRDGVKWKVLVHGEDGLVVPLWPEEEGAPDLLIHPVWKQAWIFGVVIEPRGYGKFPEKTKVRTVYIHWPDLRKPPPKGPKVKLPFRVRFSKDEIITESGSVHGPDHKQQVDVPFVVSGEHDGCSAAELNRDGSYDCRYGGYKTLADGWTYGTYNDENLDVYFEARHRETGESHLIRAQGEDEDCYSRHAVMDPPRVLVGCDGGRAVIVWTPDQTVELPLIEDATGSLTSDDGALFIGYQEIEQPNQYRDNPWVSRYWLDLPSLSSTLAPVGSSRVTSGYPYRGRWLFAQGQGRGGQFATRLGAQVQRAVPTRFVCGGAGFQDWAGDALLLGCWRGGPNPRTLDGLDLGLGLAIVLPGADNRESLITESHVLSTRRGQGELVSWRRGTIWPSSLE